MVPGAGLEPARPFRAEGFSYSLQLSLLSLATHLESGLYLCHFSVRVRHGKLGRGRQVSTLSPGSDPVQLAELVGVTVRASSKRGSRGLSSGLQAPRCGGTGSPNLTPFTPAVSEPGAQITSSPLRLPISPPGHPSARAIVCYVVSGRGTMLGATLRARTYRSALKAQPRYSYSWR